jgi:hypothetical protein
LANFAKIPTWSDDMPLKFKNQSEIGSGLAPESRTTPIDFRPIIS